MPLSRPGNTSRYGFSRSLNKAKATASNNYRLQRSTAQGYLADARRVEQVIAVADTALRRLKARGPNLSRDYLKADVLYGQMLITEDGRRTRRSRPRP